MGTLLKRVLCVGLLWIIGTQHAEAGCIIAPTGVNFGAYDVFTPAATNSTGNIFLDCLPQDNNVTITLSTGASGTFAQRTLKNGTNALVYNLYLDAALTTIWGNGTGGSSTFFRKNPPNPGINITIYGRIPALQDARAGTYSDSIVVTVLW